MCSSKPRPTAQIDRYFFSRKGKKYPTGTRANLVTTMGFWEATGRDKPIHTKLNQTLIGMRKTLVFYQGCAPHGIKTDWNLREFSLDDRSERPTHDGGWVVCCVFKKNKNLKMEMQQERATSYEEQMGALPPEALGSPNVLPVDDQLTLLEKSSRKISLKNLPGSSEKSLTSATVNSISLTSI